MKAGRFLSLLVPFAAALGVQSCFTDNPAAYQDILGRSIKEPPEEAGTTSGGTSTSAGGGGGGPAGGAPMTSGGSTAGKGGTGQGGKGGSGGNGGTGGMTPPEDPNFAPSCYRFTTQGGEEILKGTPCTPDDPHLCYRACGPNQIGWKTETCTAGVYAEGDCTFPLDKEYSCYRIPDVIDCGLAAEPTATAECDVAACTVCNLDGFYADTGGDVKEGYCVCRDPGADGVRRWTCASTTAWPCPLNSGC